MEQFDPTQPHQFALGFAFSGNGEYVVTILKTHPEPLKGKLNGLGGAKDDSDQDLVDTLVREFKEECGVATEATDWNHYFTLNRPYGDVAVYWACGDKFLQARTTTHEEIKIISTDLTQAPDPLAPDAAEMIALALEIIRNQDSQNQIIPLGLAI